MSPESSGATGREDVVTIKEQTYFNVAEMSLCMYVKSSGAEGACKYCSLLCIETSTFTVQDTILDQHCS